MFWKNKAKRRKFDQALAEDLAKGVENVREGNTTPMDFSAYLDEPDEQGKG